MIDEIRALVEMGYLLPNAKELVMADKKSNTMQTVTTHASLKVENDVKSPATCRTAITSSRKHTLLRLLGMWQ